MTTRSILITGCSSGIGRDAALALHARGWHVFASCRQEADCEGLRQMGLAAPRLDVTDAASLAAALDEVLAATGGRLDALFNNAAFALPGAVEDLPTDGLRAIFETNLFGLHELTRRVIPVMRARGAGRIVNNSSILGFTCAKWRGAYVATKFALEGLSDTLRIEMRGTGIHVVLIEPGPITTRIRQNAIPHFERWIDWQGSARRDEYAAVKSRLYEDSGPDRFELPPAAVTSRLIRALEARRPRARYRVTLPTRAAALLQGVLPTSVMDRIVLRGS